MSQSFTASSCVILRVTGDTPQWLPELRRLYAAFARLEGHTTSISQFMDFVVARADDESMLAILAALDGTAIGYCLSFDVQTHPFIPNWERSGYITNLYVEEPFRGRGVGQTLFDHSIEWLAGRNVPHLMLNVHAHNVLGQSFWRKQGFEPLLLRMGRYVRNL